MAAEPCVIDGVLIYQVLALLGYVGFLDHIKVYPAAVFMHVTLRLLGIGLAIHAIIKARRFKRENEETYLSTVF
jgi:hypothetical protein